MDKQIAAVLPILLSGISNQSCFTKVPWLDIACHAAASSVLLHQQSLNGPNNPPSSYTIYNKQRDCPMIHFHDSSIGSRFTLFLAGSC